MAVKRAVGSSIRQTFFKFALWPYLRSAISSRGGRQIYTRPLRVIYLMAFQALLKSFVFCLVLMFYFLLARDFLVQERFSQERTVTTYWLYMDICVSDYSGWISNPQRLRMRDPKNKIE